MNRSLAPIKIAERLRPFTHLPGTPLLLPGTCLYCVIFPSCIEIYDLSSWPAKCLTTIFLDIAAPMDLFTAQQDLERGWIKVWGQTATGYLSYKIVPGLKPTQVIMMIEKAPLSLSWRYEGHPPEIIVHDSNKLTPSRIGERLSLGNSKAPDWGLIQRRNDFAEILPLWHRMGIMLPALEYKNDSSGTLALLNICKEALEKEQREQILPAFKNLFLAGFSGGLTPRLIDRDCHGFMLPPPSSTTPLLLLYEGAILIRKLFVQNLGNKLHILPLLPKEFHCGRLLDVHTGWGIIDLEWTKKAIRRLAFTAEQDGSIEFEFPKNCKEFRLRSEADQRETWLSCKTPIEVKAGSRYWLDRFSQ